MEISVVAFNAFGGKIISNRPSSERMLPPAVPMLAELELPTGVPIAVTKGMKVAVVTGFDGSTSSFSFLHENMSVMKHKHMIALLFLDFIESVLMLNKEILSELAIP